MISMSRIGKFFKRTKGSKADSHGTTSANEEIEFQPGRSQDQDSHWSGTGSSGSNPSRDFDEFEGQLRRNSGSKTGGLSGTMLNQSNHSSDFNNEQKKPRPGHQENGDMRQRKDSLSNQLKTLMNPSDGLVQQSSKNLPPRSRKLSSIDSELDSGYANDHLVPQATITRTSPKAPKKLIKPGETNVVQPAFLNTTGASNLMRVTDEYTDPFDALNAQRQDQVDGYIEPYKAQQMYNDVLQGNTGLGEMKSSVSDSSNLHRRKEYDEPWDKSGQHGDKSDYEEPWDNSTATLPYAAKQSSYAGQPHTHAGLVLEYPNMIAGQESGDSSASSSSASLARQRMVRVADSPRHSPKTSPRNSPMMDRRLIRPRDSSTNSLYSAPGGGKYRPVDQRLIKAEPSLEELRRHSPSGTGSRASSATNSPMSSSQGSPLSTLTRAEADHHLCGVDDVRRASSPVNASRYILNKTKSRSLDIRNRAFVPHGMRGTKASIPKSASDDQLMQALHSKVQQYRPGANPLRGVTEYEEPWDGSAEASGRPSMVHISHSRSRSYELNTSYSYSALQPKHVKSYSFDKPEAMRSGAAANAAGKAVNYERPWDNHDIVPQGHLESWQRFQHHQLELHPSEAINDRDCDPLLPLEKQSWYHGPITRDEAIRRLENQIEGSYLVRNSESIPNNFSLSLRTRSETIHMVVSRTRDGFWILGEFSAPFHSVPEMIAHYATHRLKINDSHHISLSHPVPEEYL